jgi:hypothetical protein
MTDIPANEEILTLLAGINQKSISSQEKKS